MLSKQACWRFLTIGLLCCGGIALISDSVTKTTKTKLVLPFQYQSTPVDDDGVISRHINQEDDRLVKYVQNFLIRDPSELPYKFKDGKSGMSLDTALFVENGKPWLRALDVVEHFLPKRRRTFVECGAADGEYESWTLVLEQRLNWTGLLIEADPIYFKALAQVNRQAHIANVCIGSKTYPYFAKFQHEGDKTVWYQKDKKVYESADPGQGHVINKHLGYKTIENNGEVDILYLYRNVLGRRSRQEIDVLCVPIYTLLKATNLTVVDLVIIEFHEDAAEVLATIPYELVDLGVIAVRYVQRAVLERITKVLKAKGYTLAENLKMSNVLGYGFFVKSGYYRDTEKAVT